MRVDWIVALTLASLALGEPAVVSAAPSSARCASTVTRTIAFTEAHAHDVLEVSAAGVDCAKAVVTVSIRRANGVPVAAFAVPFAWLREIDPAKPMTRAALNGYLRTYIAEAQLDVAAGTLPVWTADAPTPGFDQGQELTSPLPRDWYEELRAAKPNMLCLRDAHETFACYVWDAKRNSTEVIVRH
ncbi:MAG: hypothetical protein KBA31_14410 [Alphaproteobacteria bacterium]|nr:hypothetical protein [Alphaproteobacteria bacterium]